MQRKKLTLHAQSLCPNDETIKRARHTIPLGGRKTAAPKPAVREAKEVPRWRVTLPDGRAYDCNASTKGEARAKAKDKLGCDDRLPIGTTVARLAN